MIGKLVRRLLPLSLCSVCGIVLAAFAFSHGLLSSRGLRVVLLILGIGIATWAPFLFRKTGRELKVSSVVPPGSSVPANIRMLRLGMLAESSRWLHWLYSSFLPCAGTALCGQ